MAGEKETVAMISIHTFSGIFARTSDEMYIICEKKVSGPLVGTRDIR